MNRQHSSARILHARSPTATSGESVRLSTGKPAARIDETNKETHSSTIPNPRFARNVPTVIPFGWTAEEPHRTCISKNSPRPLPSHVAGRVSKQKCVLVLFTIRKQFVGLLLRTMLRRRGQLLEINSQTSRCLMQRSLPP